MIEPVQSKSKQVASLEQQTQPALRTQAEERRDPPVAAAGGQDVQVNDRQKRVAPSNAGFEVRLDGSTMRLYSEMRDPTTNRVVVRLPVGYQPESEKPAAMTPPVSVLA